MLRKIPVITPYGELLLHTGAGVVNNIENLQLEATQSMSVSGAFTLKQSQAVLKEIITVS